MVSSDSGIIVTIAGCDSLTRKKIKLYREQHPFVQLFFMENRAASEGFDESTDVAILPESTVSLFLGMHEKDRLLLPPLIAYGASGRMRFALAAGCSDYLCEPWTVEELFARTLKCSRQTELVSGDKIIIAMDGRRLGLLSGGDGVLIGTVKLSRNEYLLFRILCRNRGVFLNRETLSTVLKLNTDTASRAVDMQVSRLRKKITELLRIGGSQPEADLLLNSTGRGWSLGN